MTWADVVVIILLAAAFPVTIWLLTRGESDQD